MSRRRLRPDELDVWRKVARTTERMHPDRTEPQPFAPKPLAAPSSERPGKVIPPFQIGQKATPKLAGNDVLPSAPDRLKSAPVRMDKKTFGRLKRGKLKPEGRIDLHGMTLDQAHPALNTFIMRSYAEGRRLVLVITGKGKVREDDGPIPVRPGILRHNVPHWLRSPPLSHVVLQVSEAHLRHGGGGAYYVYLARQR